MEAISVFDMLKIGIGPSSSHTLGPWRAAERFIREVSQQTPLEQVSSVIAELYGSLALTGKGHGTDIALLMGLSGADPVRVPVEEVKELPLKVQLQNRLLLGGKHPINFNPEAHILFRFSDRLPGHANGMKLRALDGEGAVLYEGVYYSVGGGFVVKEGEEESVAGKSTHLPYPIHSGADLLSFCGNCAGCISDIVLENEKVWRSEEEIFEGLENIWMIMQASVFRGCHTEGRLPGGLNVRRRAMEISRKLLPDADYSGPEEWMKLIKKSQPDFSKTMKWIGCFAMAVNEENANFGRIVTAPTNGASGVIPAVLMYYCCFTDVPTTKEDIHRFLLVAGEIGSLFKKGSTISAAMGGCQAEIGVSSAMAAGALAERLGGNAGQVLMASEIAMEHHLGLTCDPVGGLVQVPCIERNSMGAVKAIMAAKIALESDPFEAKVSLDEVIKTMWETAQDMHTKYKETSQGGLATNIAISVPEC